jgi:hypothetical protein
MRLAIILGALSFLAGCSSGPNLADDWKMETNTNSWACGFLLRSDKTFNQNCNGENIIRGTWALDGESIRFIQDTGRTSVCQQSFDGSVLVLRGLQCLFPGRYQRAADFWRDHPIN